MQERILALAAGIAGAEEEELELLAALCLAAEMFWTDRLKAEVNVGACGEAFCCAAAFTAAADFAVSRGSREESFSAGEISVKAGNCSDRLKRADALRKSAERLMAPYADAGEICFRGVRG